MYMVTDQINTLVHSLFHICQISAILGQLAQETETMQIYPVVVWRADIMLPQIY